LNYFIHNIFQTKS